MFLKHGESSLGLFVCQMLPELLRLNPQMTEEEATKSAELDADGMLTYWGLECQSLEVLPECESYLSLRDYRLPEWLRIVLTCPQDIELLSLHFVAVP